MTGSDVFCMPMETTILNPVSGDGNAFPNTITSLAYSESFDLNNHNKFMTGYSVHSMLQDETINHFQASMNIPNYSKASDSDTVRDLQLGKDIIGDFVSGTSHPINNTIQDRLTEGMPLPAASLATLLAYKYGPHKNLEKFATSAPALAYPLEFAKTIVMNDYSDTINHSIGNSLNCGYEGVPIDSSTRWDFNKVVGSPERSGTITGRTVLQPFHLVGNITTNGCISSENARMSSYSPSGSSRYSNELSLSLAMSQPSVVCGTSIQDQRSDISCSGISNHSLYEPHVGQEQTSCSNSSKPGQLSQFLSGSRYLCVMQEILADFAHYSSGNLNLMSYPAIGTVNNANTCIHSSDAAAGCCSTLGYIDRSLDQMEPTFQGWDFERRRKKHLLTLLQEVDNQYNQLLDEIHTVISAFHAVTELDPQIHARFALQTISFLYKDLRERISSHILAMGACFSKVGATEEEKSFEMSFIQKQWALQQLRRKDQQLWRPQRGLPERSVSVLRAWMFQNFLHPYPKDAEKHLLAVKSGLTRSQVSNWFINARVRLWKPMIEEMYAEMNRRKNRRNEAENDNCFRNHATIETRRFSPN